MNKDALLATGIGVFIGLAIAGIVLGMPVFLSVIKTVSIPVAFQKKEPAVTPGSGNTLGKTTDSSNVFSIDSPLEESVEQNSELLISGTANSGNIVVIQGEIDDTVTIANDQGAYAAKITLAEGINKLVISSFQGNQKKEITRTVYFTPQSL